MASRQLSKDAERRFTSTLLQVVEAAMLLALVGPLDWPAAIFVTLASALIQKGGVREKILEGSPWQIFRGVVLSWITEWLLIFLGLIGSWRISLPALVDSGPAILHIGRIALLFAAAVAAVRGATVLITGFVLWCERWGGLRHSTR